MRDSGTAARAKAGLDAFDLFFTRPDEAGKIVPAEEPMLRRLRGLLAGLAAGGKRIPGEASPADYFNALLREGGAPSLDARLRALLFEAFIEHRVLPGELTAQSPGRTASFLLEKAAALLRAVAEAAPSLDAEERARTLPAALDLFTAPVPDSPEELASLLAECDRFHRHRVFRFIDGKFLPAEVDSAKPLDRFFGYPGVRSAFRDHFRKFAAGKTNLPLLVNSLPGHGKTSLTVSHVLAQPGLVLILPEPEALEQGWRELVEPLAARPDHRFVLFFDDIDPRHTDWYQFRTNVGGAFSLPENVMPVLSANYEFPANILSRGRKVSFPVFDEVRCMEMVEDFLTGFGVKRTAKNLISIISADYTEEFSQKKFTELSPRSLIRYLSGYEHDQIKRKTMVELSFGPMITRPDAELFYEFNIELMRSLYGEEYIQKLLKERLKALE